MPIHRGHQLLIETALAEVDDLTIVVYQSDVEGTENMPIEKRIKWIAELYPQVENIVPVIDDLPGHHTEHDGPGSSQHYAEQLAFLGPFNYVFSSEEYGEPFAAAITEVQGSVCHPVSVDNARELVPISGTQIRNNLYDNRAYLDPVVYRSLIQKVVFVGTESTGKSTIAERMASYYRTRWVHEYGRELWIDQNLKGTFHDMLKIANTQYEREQAAQLHSRKFLFCDTNPWTTMVWSEMYSGTADARLIQLAEATKGEYIWFFCENDFEWVDDGVRELRGPQAQELADRISDTLYEMEIPFYTLYGPLESRVQQVLQILTPYDDENPLHNKSLSILDNRLGI